MAYNDGGPAFPQCVSQGLSGELVASYQMQDGGGMTLRDWFAGQALVGLPAVCVGDTLLNGETFEQHIARNAYEMADAMLAARDAS